MLLLLGLLLPAGCGETLAPPADPMPELPPLGPVPTPLANRPPADEWILPEEAAGRALAGFLEALAQDDRLGASTYLDETGTSLVRALRDQLEGGGEAGDRARAFWAGAELKELHELSETRVAGRLWVGPGASRTFGLEMREDRHGLWLITRLHALPVR